MRTFRNATTIFVIDFPDVRMLECEILHDEPHYNHAEAPMQIGLFGVLAIIFVLAKLMNVISWSWWIVLLPVYGPLLLVIVLLFAAYAIAVAVE